LNWNQLKTILRLRWQLTRNQWARSKHGLRAAISILAACAAGILAAVCFLGGLFGAALGLRDAPPSIIMLMWMIFVAAFLFFWTVGLLMELQRSETIDLQRLMHLPVRLGQIFVINYFASHFSFGLIVAVPAAIGFSLGLTIARGPLMLLLLPLSLSMIFMITAWTYYLRGSLAALMTNPRRRRNIIVILTFLFVLIAQGPNIYFNVLGGASPSRKPNAFRRDVKAIEAVQKFIPPFWVSLSAGSLAEKNPWVALLSITGFVVIGGLGLHRAYRGTLAYYYGETGGKAEAKVSPLTKTRRKPRRTGHFMEIRLPGVNDQAGAIALASIRSMLRAPEVKMAWAMSFLVTAIVGGSLLFRSGARIPEQLKPFVALGATAFSLFVLFQLLGNLFGFDRDGFGAFVVSPVNRKMILLGKNLSTLPMIACSGVLLMLIVTVWLHLSFLTALAALFQIATVSIIACIFGNLLSVAAPYRIQPGSLKPTKIPASTALVMILCQLLFPIAMLPVFLPPLIELLCRLSGVSTGIPISLMLSVALLILAVVVYWLLLAPMGRFLQQREMKILQTVITEVE
jgi:hypothetical protein